MRGAGAVPGDDRPAVGQLTASQGVPRVSIGSMASAMPGVSRGPLPRLPWFGTNGPCAWPCRCRGRRNPDDRTVSAAVARRRTSRRTSRSPRTRHPAGHRPGPPRYRPTWPVSVASIRSTSRHRRAAPPRAARSPSRSASRPGCSRRRWTAGRRPAGPGRPRDAVHDFVVDRRADGRREAAGPAVGAVVQEVADRTGVRDHGRDGSVDVTGADAGRARRPGRQRSPWPGPTRRPASPAVRRGS